MYTLRLTEQTNMFVAASADRPTVHSVYWPSSGPAVSLVLIVVSGGDSVFGDVKIDLVIFQNYLVDQLGKLWWSIQWSIWRSIGGPPHWDEVSHTWWSIRWAN